MRERETGDNHAQCGGRPGYGIAYSNGLDTAPVGAEHPNQDDAQDADVSEHDCGWDEGMPEAAHGIRLYFEHGVHVIKRERDAYHGKPDGYHLFILVEHPERPIADRKHYHARYYRSGYA